MRKITAQEVLKERLYLPFTRVVSKTSKKYCGNNTTVCEKSVAVLSGVPNVKNIAMI